MITWFDMWIFFILIMILVLAIEYFVLVLLVKSYKIKKDIIEWFFGYSLGIIGFMVYVLYIGLKYI